MQAVLVRSRERGIREREIEIIHMRDPIHLFVRVLLSPLAPFSATSRERPTEPDGFRVVEEVPFFSLLMGWLLRHAAELHSAFSVGNC